MPTADDIKVQQKNQWGAAAEGWGRHDEWFQRQTGPLTEWLCTAAGVAPGSRVLDIACGAGQPALTAAALAGPAGHVIAIDISPQMLAVAAAKARAAGLTNLETQEMDAENLRFPDESFDAVTCRFGLMFCPDPVRAASEIRRVLKPGGRFALSVWDDVAKNEFFTSIAGPLAKVAPPPASPPDPKAPGMFRLAQAAELEAILRAAGFANPAVGARPMVWEYASADEYWEIQNDLVAPLQAALASLSPGGAAKLKEAVFEGLRPHTTGGVVRLAAVPLCASGTK